MSAAYHQVGTAIDYTAAADQKSGDIVAVGTLKGIAVRDVKDGETGALAVAGVYKVPSTVTNVGAQVTLRVTEQDAVATAISSPYDGIVVGVHETGVALVRLERGLTGAE